MLPSCSGCSARSRNADDRHLVCTSRGSLETCGCNVLRHVRRKGDRQNDTTVVLSWAGVHGVTVLLASGPCEFQRSRQERLAWRPRVPVRLWRSVNGRSVFRIFVKLYLWFLYVILYTKLWVPWKIGLVIVETAFKDANKFPLSRYTFLDRFGWNSILGFHLRLSCKPVHWKPYFNLGTCGCKWNCARVCYVRLPIWIKFSTSDSPQKFDWFLKIGVVKALLDVRPHMQLSAYCPHLLWHVCVKFGVGDMHVMLSSRSEFREDRCWRSAVALPRAPWNRMVFWQ